MQYCSRCVYPDNHPLNIVFSKNALCSGCLVHEEKDQLDWTTRFDNLTTIVDQYRNISGNNYDCIVPVTGANDSYYIVHVVKNILRLNPLLVTYNKHYNTEIGIRNIAYLRTLFDCDILTLTVSTDVYL